jgi:hypothetical protein
MRSEEEKSWSISIYLTVKRRDPVYIVDYTLFFKMSFSGYHIGMMIYLICIQSLSEKVTSFGLINAIV